MTLTPVGLHPPYPSLQTVGIISHPFLSWGERGLGQALGIGGSQRGTEPNQVRFVRVEEEPRG